MKKLLLLSTSKSENKENLTAYLKDKLKGKIDVSLGLFSDLVIEIDSGNVNIEIAGRNIRDFDLVYIRQTKGFMSLAKTFGIALKFLEVPFLDSVWGKANCGGNKLTSQIRLAADKMPVIPSFFCSKDYLFTNFKRFSQKYGLPLVAKELTLQRLKGIYLIRTRKDLAKLPSVNAKGGKKDYLFQKFLDFDREYRLLVLGRKVAVVHTKVKRNFRGLRVVYENSNDQAVFLDPKSVPQDMRKLAIKSAKALGLEIAGVDACIESKTGKIYLIEVNRGPGIDYDTKVSPELSALAKFFAKELEV